MKYCAKARLSYQGGEIEIRYYSFFSEGKYGIIATCENDAAAVCGVSRKFSDIVCLIDCLASEQVFPCHLQEVLEELCCSI